MMEIWQPSIAQIVKDFSAQTGTSLKVHPNVSFIEEVWDDIQPIRPGLPVLIIRQAPSALRPVLTVMHWKTDTVNWYTDVSQIKENYFDQLDFASRRCLIPVESFARHETGDIYAPIDFESIVFAGLYSRKSHLYNETKNLRRFTLLSTGGLDDDPCPIELKCEEILNWIDPKQDFSTQKLSLYDQGIRFP